MASIQINSVSNTNVSTTSVTLTISLNFSNTNYYEEKYFSIETNMGTIVPLKGTITSGNYTITVSGLSVGVSNSLKLTMNYEYRTKTNTLYYFYTIDDSTLHGPYGTYNAADAAKTSFEADGYTTGAIFQETAWTDWYTSSTYSNIITVYTKPSGNFSFGLTEGYKWNINKALTTEGKVAEFNTVAGKYLSWKNQSSSVIGTQLATGKLTANNLNGVYAALGKSTNYKSGEKISYTMFKGLEDIINGNS